MGSVGARQNQMNVPIEQWGTILDGADIIDLRDEEGTYIGIIQDEYRYPSEYQLDPVTKKDAVDFALAYYSKEDGGWLVDDDVHIYFAYEDGTFRDVADDPKRGLNRRGLIGVYVSTSDDEVAWGGNIGRQGQFQQWGVHDSDGNEVEGNYHAWYKTTGYYIERVKITYNNPNGRGGYRTKREVIRRSTTKWR